MPGNATEMLEPEKGSSKVVTLSLSIEPKELYCVKAAVVQVLLGQGTFSTEKWRFQGYFFRGI